MTRRSRLVVLALACALAGCSTSSRPRAVVDRSPTAVYSNRTLLAWVEEFRRALVMETRGIGTTILDATDDPKARDAAFRWALVVDREAARAAGRADGFVAAVDVWALVVQLLDYFEHGDGAAMFPAQRGNILAMLRKFDAEARSAFERLGDDELKAHAEQEIADWREKWPMRGDRFLRISTAPMMSEFLGQGEASVFDVIGSLEESVERVETSIQDVTYDLPTQFAIQLALLVEQYLEILDVHGARDQLDRTVAVVETLPEWGEQQREHAIRVLKEERELVLADVERQRLDTIARVDALTAREREAVLTALEDTRSDVLLAVTAERTATLEQVEEMRTATLGQVESMRVATVGRVEAVLERTVDRSAERAEEIVASALVKTGIAVGVLGLCALGALLYVVRVFRPR